MFLLLFSIYIFTLVFTFLGWVCIQKHVFQIYYLIKKMNLNDGFIHSYFKIFCSTQFLTEQAVRVDRTPIYICSSAAC